MALRSRCASRPGCGAGWPWRAGFSGVHVPLAFQQQIGSQPQSASNGLRRQRGRGGRCGGGTGHGGAGCEQGAASMPNASTQARGRPCSVPCVCRRGSRRPPPWSAARAASAVTTVPGTAGDLRLPGAGLQGEPWVCWWAKRLAVDEARRRRHGGGRAGASAQRHGPGLRELSRPHPRAARVLPLCAQLAPLGLPFCPAPLSRRWLGSVQRQALGARACFAFQAQRGLRQLPVQLRFPGRAVAPMSPRWWRLRCRWPGGSTRSNCGLVSEVCI